MLLAVTSIMTWWFLSPPMAVNRLRITVWSPSDRALRARCRAASSGGPAAWTTCRLGDDRRIDVGEDALTGLVGRHRGDDRALRHGDDHRESIDEDEGRAAALAGR